MNTDQTQMSQFITTHERSIPRSITDSCLSPTLISVTVIWVLLYGCSIKLYIFQHVISMQPLKCKYKIRFSPKCSAASKHWWHRKLPIEKNGKLYVLK